MNIKKPSNENGSKIIFSYVPVRATADGGTNPAENGAPFGPLLWKEGRKNSPLKRGVAQPKVETGCVKSCALNNIIFLNVAVGSTADGGTNACPDVESNVLCGQDKS